MNPKLNFLARKYASDMVFKGSELLMPLDTSPEFVKDLVEVGEIIMGCDGWRYVDKSKGHIVQVLEVELSVDEFIPWNEMTPQKNANIVLNFIKKLHPSIDLISLNLNDPQVKEALSRGATDL